MKKMFFGAIVAAALSLVAKAEEVSLGWVFMGYFENVGVFETQVTETVDASIAATAEAELDISSFPCGTMLFFR